MLARLGPRLYVAGRADEGERYVDEAVAINREIGYQFGLVESLHILSGAYRKRDDLAGCQDLLEESLGIAREIDDELWIGWDLGMLALIAGLRGDVKRAWALGCEALARARQRDSMFRRLAGLAELAVIAVLSGDRRRAALLWGAAGARLDAELGPSLFETERDEPRPSSESATRSSKPLWPKGTRSSWTRVLELALVAFREVGAFRPFPSGPNSPRTAAPPNRGAPFINTATPSQACLRRGEAPDPLTLESGSPECNQGCFKLPPDQGMFARSRVPLSLDPDRSRRRAGCRCRAWGSRGAAGTPNSSGQAVGPAFPRAGEPRCCGRILAGVPETRRRRRHRGGRRVPD